MTTTNTKDDIAIIRTLLKKVRNLAQNHRYGGYYDRMEKAIAALHALDRIEKELTEKQMLLL